MSNIENIEKITQWAEASLVSHGYIIKSLPETIQTTPWSRVSRFLTARGYVYLKQTPPKLSLEPRIIQILSVQNQENVPFILGANKELHCFLMKDAGTPLREIFKNSFQPSLLAKAIKKYILIQESSEKHIQQFLDLGVPDWRLNQLPTLYAQLIGQESLLLEDGLTHDEIFMLHKLYPQFTSMCQSLSQYKIPEVLDHCDFHDNNILIKDENDKVTIIDLGETTIAHPFFSLITCLRNAIFRYVLNEVDKTYLMIQDACLDADLFRFEEKSTLLEAFSLAKKLWPIYASLGEYRLILSSDVEEFKKLNRRGRLSLGLKEFAMRERK